MLRAGDVPSIENRGAGCTIRILSPPEEAGQHEVYELDINAGGELDSQPHTRGAREHLTVIDGQVPWGWVSKCTDASAISSDGNAIRRSICM